MEYSSKLDTFNLDSLGTDHFYLLFQNFSLYVFVHFVYLYIFVFVYTEINH